MEVFCFVLFWLKIKKKNKKKRQQNFPLRHPSASPRLCLPLSMAAAPVVTSCRCRTPAAWWTCKQHGHSYIFPSGRLGAVSTILFTLWIPRTRSRPAPLFFRESFLACALMLCVFACAWSGSLLPGVRVCGVSRCCDGLNPRWSSNSQGLSCQAGSNKGKPSRRECGEGVRIGRQTLAEGVQREAGSGVY